MLSLARSRSHISTRSLSQASRSLQLSHAMSTRSMRLSPLAPLRPALRSMPPLLSKAAAPQILQQLRLNSTSAPKKGEQAMSVQGNESEEVEELTEEEEAQIAKEIEDYLKGLAEMWPVCESPAPGWSSDWSKWENLNSYFGPSPYYLNLPQVEMLVNIHYGVGGEVVPVLYSNEQDAFIFVLQDDDEATSNFVLFDATANTMKSLPASDVEELKKHMTEHGSNVLDLPGTVIEPDQEGQLVAQAIIKGDERILPFVDQFLPMSLEERGAITAEQAAAIAEAQDAIEKMQDAEESVDLSLEDELAVTKEQLQKLLDEVVDETGEAADEKRRILEEMKNELLEESGVNEIKTK